jgi:sec-independent protein translocase protein TatA
MNFTMLGTFLAGWEVVLILAIVLVLFVAKRLPEIAKAFGDGLSLFRKECDDQAHDAGRSLGGIYGKPAVQALTVENQVAELYDPAVLEEKESKGKAGIRSWFRRWIRFFTFLWRSIVDRLRSGG